MFSGSVRIVGDMHRAGVSILVGTDTGFPAFSLHDELALLIESGMSSMAALQAATSNAARFMGQLDRRGTIEIGKIADLVLLNKDPLVDITTPARSKPLFSRGNLCRVPRLMRC
jgi:imidazolonepropionase-like amidohydrolase